MIIYLFTTFLFRCTCHYLKTICFSIDSGFPQSFIKDPNFRRRHFEGGRPIASKSAFASDRSDIVPPLLHRPPLHNQRGGFTPYKQEIKSLGEKDNQIESKRERQSANYILFPVGAAMGEQDCLLRLACLSGKHAASVSGATTLTMLLSTAYSVMPEGMKEPYQARIYIV